eukprot:CAMPEP_0119559854 /NCGR_PEP_ID=MMETSP1352-20130426/13479_1 /TAXON_ID=265584 /ORGANISM="Stauroneis constricta, Strain CCMP1120" /LENGTH=301 /DNA_ID=CAMNT_0007607659 /DNA_START=26 /DNA_END=928 /DNA_ORIENTATION=+
MSAVEPPLLQQKDPDNTVLQNLVCTICQKIPHVDPIITQCQHVFCKSCYHGMAASMTDHYDGTLRCPNDRSVITSVSPLSGIVRRMWEEIPVKCSQDGCNWTGSMGSYAEHTRHRCNGGRSSRREIDILRAKCERLENENEDLENKVADLEESKRKLENKVKQEKKLLEEQNTELQNKVADLKTKVQDWKRLHARSNFDGNYSALDRNNVVKLAQLICKDLECPPSTIDNNRIYNCVGAIYKDLLSGYNDNPKHFDIDVKMLLTCAWHQRGFQPISATESGNGAETGGEEHTDFFPSRLAG